MVSSGDMGEMFPSEPNALRFNGLVPNSSELRCVLRPSRAAFRSDPFLRLVFCCWTATAIARPVFFGDKACSRGFSSGLRGVSAWISLSSALARSMASFDGPPEGVRLWLDISF